VSFPCQSSAIWESYTSTAYISMTYGRCRRAKNHVSEFRVDNDKMMCWCRTTILARVAGHARGARCTGRHAVIVLSTGGSGVWIRQRSWTHSRGCRCSSRRWWYSWHMTSTWGLSRCRVRGRVDSAAGWGHDKTVLPSPIPWQSPSERLDVYRHASPSPSAYPRGCPKVVFTWIR
jgi:hypothetical protein